MDGMQEDIRHNGPPYVPWNIALQEDLNFHVILVSHLRRNNEAECKIDRRDGVVPLPGMTCADLNTGDGVVFISAILHCATSSRQKNQRTLQLTFEGFGNLGSPHHIEATNLGIDFVEHLSPPAEERFRNFHRLRLQRLDEIAGMFRAMFDRDEPLFPQTLQRLHTGSCGRMATLEVVSRFAYRIFMAQKQSTNESDCGNAERIKYVADRFTSDEIKQPWQRFAVLEAKLQADQVQHIPLFQGNDAKYHRYEMPEDFDMADFINSWE